MVVTQAAFPRIGLNIIFSFLSVIPLFYRLAKAHLKYTVLEAKRYGVVCVTSVSLTLGVLLGFTPFRFSLENKFIALVWTFPLQSFPGLFFFFSTAPVLIRDTKVENVF